MPILGYLMRQYPAIPCMISGGNPKNELCMSPDQRQCEFDIFPVLLSIQIVTRTFGCQGKCLA